MLGSSTPQSSWVLAYRYADTPQRRPRSRLIVDRNLNDRLSLGLEYNSLVEEFQFRGTWVALAESAKDPQIHLGTSSDRIGTPEGKLQYSVTIGKSLAGTPLAPYVSLTYSEFNKGLVYPFGLNYQLTRNWGLLAMNDGSKSHLMLNFSARDYYAQLGWIWLRHPSVTLGWRW